MSGEKLGWNESAEGWEHMDEVPMENVEVELNKVETNPEKRAEERQEEIEKAKEAVLEAFKTNDSFQEVAPANLEPVSSEKRQKMTVWQTVGKVTRAAGHGTLMAGACAGVVIAPYLAPVLLPVAFLAAGSMIHSIRGVNGSMFEVGKNNKITQTANPIPTLVKYHGESSLEIFKKEAEKLFNGLTPGETYSTRSHAVTYGSLKELQKEGRIANLQREKDGESRLLLANLATGNFKAIFKNKKHDMYKITFEVVK